MTNIMSITIKKISNGYTVTKEDTNWDYDKEEKDEKVVYCIDLVDVVDVIDDLTTETFGE